MSFCATNYRLRFVVLIAALLAIGPLVGSAAGCSDAPPADTLVMPNVVGKFWVDAEPELRALGWTGIPTFGGEVPGAAANRNRVVSQDPAAETVQKTDISITLKFGA